MFVVFLVARKGCNLWILYYNPKDFVASWKTVQTAVGREEAHKKEKLTGWYSDAETTLKVTQFVRESGDIICR